VTSEPIANGLDGGAGSPRPNRRQRRAEAKRRKRSKQTPPGAADAQAALLASAIEHHQQGRLQEAHDLYRQILAARPDHPDALHLLGVIALQAGDPATAVELIGNAVALNGGIADYHNNLGLALTGLERAEDAVAALERALTCSPDHAIAHNNLGNALKALGRAEAALAAYERALALDPVYVEAHNNRGNALVKLGRPEEALPAYRRALELNPDYADGHNNLGNALQALGQLEPAMESYRAALGLRPDFAEAHNNMGGALLEARQPEAAVQSFELALEARPAYAEAYSNLGNTLRELGRLGDAKRAIERALELKPGLAEAHANLGNVLSGMGLAEEAIARHRAALDLAPEEPEAYRCLLLAMLYASAHDNDALFAEHRRFEELYARPHYGAIRSHDRGDDPERRLRIGYLSSDFRQHPVGHNILPALSNHDRARVEVFCYADVALPDEMTERFRALADHWRPITGARDVEVAERIRDDRIDILVCTAAHLDRNRPGVLAHKPAPLQVSWHDAATTGLETVDYLLTDALIHPPGTTERFTESRPRRWLCGRAP
jgi:predicted O-linked N-acetylglucosamine transferase (SPINDLY family)